MGSASEGLTDAIFAASLWAPMPVAVLIVAALTFSRFWEEPGFRANASLFGAGAAAAVAGTIPFLALMFPAVQAAGGNWGLLLAIPIGVVWGFISGGIAALATTFLLPRIGTPALRIVIAVAAAVFLGTAVAVLNNVLFYRPA